MVCACAKVSSWRKARCGLAGDGLIRGMGVYGECMKATGEFVGECFVDQAMAVDA